MCTVLDCSLRVTGFIGGRDKRLQSSTEHIIFNRVEATQTVSAWLNKRQFLLKFLIMTLYSLPGLVLCFVLDYIHSMMLFWNYCTGYDQEKNYFLCKDVEPCAKYKCVYVSSVSFHLSVCL